MNYEQACATEITRDVARREVEAHDIPFSEFLEEVGDRDTYKGREVLDWLGY